MIKKENRIKIVDQSAKLKMGLDKPTHNKNLMEEFPVKNQNLVKVEKRFRNEFSDRIPG